MDLPLSSSMEFGIQTIHRRTEPATGRWLPKPDDARALVELVDRCGYESLWVGDHMAFAIPILDPLLQLMQAATYSRRLTLGTAVYLLPLRHPAPVAKQVATLDLLTEGRLIFGVGIGGEFPNEYAVCGVPIHERGARLSEGIAVLRKLWSGERVANQGRFYPFPEVEMLPPPAQSGGPPIWCGGRSDQALERAGAMADGWVSYVVTPDMYRRSLEKIARARQHSDVAFATGHLLFACIDDTYEGALEKAATTLSVRYAMDFTKPAKKYAALGRPSDIAENLERFHAAGVRHVIMDFVGPYEERDLQIERFAKEVRPLLAHC